MGIIVTNPLHKQVTDSITALGSTQSSNLSTAIGTVNGTISTLDGKVVAIETAISNGTIVESIDLKLVRTTQTETLVADTTTITLTIPYTSAKDIIDITDEGLLLATSDYTIDGTTITIGHTLLSGHVIKIMVTRISTT